jgi:indole-3-acetate monooxygenase
MSTATATASATASATEEELALRADLLARVEQVRPILERTAAQTEAQGFLAEEAVEALHDTGLLRIKVTQEAGGLEASPPTQFVVIAALSEIDAAAGWNVMVNNNTSGFLSAFLGPEAFAEVFSDGIPIGAGVAPAMGKARKTDGGWILNGTWKTCSGVKQASWLRLTGANESGQGNVFCVLPKTDATVHLDSWDVLGLKGTGSFDVSVENLFIPERFAFTEEQQFRGGPQYSFRGLAASSYEHSSIAVGLGRRALAELAALAARKNKRAEPLLTDLGRYTARLEAVETSALTVYESTYRILSEGGSDLTGLGLRGQTIAALATDTAQEVIETAYRHAGTAALYLPNAFEKLLRDIHGATQHIAVSHAYYRELGERLVSRATA